MFDTFVINLEKDYKNYEVLHKKFKKIGIDLIRFNAIYGKKIKNMNKYNKYLSNYCKFFCPKSIIGCGLSHYILLENIYNKYIKNPEKNNDYCLILEDDINPLFKNKNEINEIIKKIPKKCDIVSLYCQCFCNTKNKKKIFF